MEEVVEVEVGVEETDDDHDQLEDVVGEDSRVDCILQLQPCCSRSSRS